MVAPQRRGEGGGAGPAARPPSHLSVFDAAGGGVALRFPGVGVAGGPRRVLGLPSRGRAAAAAGARRAASAPALRPPDTTFFQRLCERCAWASRRGAPRRRRPGTAAAVVVDATAGGSRAARAAPDRRGPPPQLRRDRCAPSSTGAAGPAASSRPAPGDRAAAASTQTAHGARASARASYCVPRRREGPQTGALAQRVAPAALRVVDVRRRQVVAVPHEPALAQLEGPRQIFERRLWSSDARSDAADRPSKRWRAPSPRAGRWSAPSRAHDLALQRPQPDRSRRGRRRAALDRVERAARRPRRRVRVRSYRAPRCRGARGWASY